MSIKGIIIGGIGVVVGAIGFSQGMKYANEVREFKKTFNEAVVDIEKMTTVDVKEEVVQKAVNNVVERKVGSAVTDAVNFVKDTIRDDISNKVTNSIKDAYDSIKDSVSDKVKNEVTKIDISALKKRVTEEAKNEIVNRFDGQLDGLIEEYRKNLSNITRIYQSIADTMEPGKRLDNPGKIFNLNL